MRWRGLLIYARIGRVPQSFASAGSATVVFPHLFFYHVALSYVCPPIFFLLSCLSSSSKFDSVGSSVKFLNGLKLLYFSCFDLLLS